MTSAPTQYQLKGGLGHVYIHGHVRTVGNLCDLLLYIGTCLMTLELDLRPGRMCVSCSWHFSLWRNFLLFVCPQVLLFSFYIRVLARTAFLLLSWMSREY